MRPIEVTVPVLVPEDTRVRIQLRWEARKDQLGALQDAGITVAASRGYVSGDENIAVGTLAQYRAAEDLLRSHGVARITVISMDANPPLAADMSSLLTLLPEGAAEPAIRIPALRDAEVRILPDGRAICWAPGFLDAD